MIRGYFYSQHLRRKHSQGFTIVELLIAVIVIAILATITVVAYSGVSNQAKESLLKSDLQAAAKQLQLAKVEAGSFPSSATGIQHNSNVSLQYSGGSDAFCLTGVHSQLAGKSFFVTEAGVIQAGECPPAITDGVPFQVVTAANCPAARTRAVDARDKHTYWIQKLADGKCWMLTNLAYGGGVSNGGTSVYGDVKTLQDGTGDTTVTYTAPKYYVTPENSNNNVFTLEPTEPSTMTNGRGQYGYLYNWCSAMGAPISSDSSPSLACVNVEDTSAPLPDAGRSVCPAGWRLPTGRSGGELQSFAQAIGATDNSAGSQELRGVWFGQMSGNWYNSYNSGSGYYWSSTYAPGSGGTAAGSLIFSGTSVKPATLTNALNGLSVRCIAV